MTLVQIGIMATLAGILPELIENGLSNIISEFSPFINNLIELVFFIEKSPGLVVDHELEAAWEAVVNSVPALVAWFGNKLWKSAVLTPASFEAAFNKTYLFLANLVSLRFIWKGFKTYVLCRDGDPDSSPLQMLGGTLLAIAVSAAFPYLYELGYKIIDAMTQSIITAFGIKTDNLYMLISASTSMINISGSYVSKIITAIYLFCLVIFFIKMAFKGAEMVFYRLGIPIAASGLAEPDGGGWKEYISVLFRMYLCVAVQYLSLVLSLSLLAVSSRTSGILLSMAFLLMAMNAPSILSQWMPASRPSGAGQLASTGMQVGRAGAGVVGWAGRTGERAASWVGSLFRRR